MCVEAGECPGSLPLRFSRLHVIQDNTRRTIRELDQTNNDAELRSSARIWFEVHWHDLQRWRLTFALTRAGREARREPEGRRPFGVGLNALLDGRRLISNLPLALFPAERVWDSARTARQHLGRTTAPW